MLQKNIDSNRLNLPEGSGTIQTRELDWTVEPEHWTWTHPSVIGSFDYSNLDAPTETLRPPFDLILTADTLYCPQLAGPLLRALHTLSSTNRPPIYVALERRDPRLVDGVLQQARDSWSFSVQRIPDKKVTKAMVKAGCKWDKTEWEGVEIWKLILQTA